jgi:tetratricopeptide (TPR) repeat protein
MQKFFSLSKSVISKSKKNYFHSYFTAAFLFLLIYSCSNNPEANDGSSLQGKNNKRQTTNDKLTWLNHSDSVKYVGKETCRGCHQEIYNSFLRTGMGHSFDRPESFSMLKEIPMKIVYDQHSDFYYQPVYSDGNLFMKEFRLKGRDTVYSRVEKADYVIGHGLQTVSFLQDVNGYLNQMPITYYTQIKKWDLSPGFENGNNTRFSRKIGLECMACHNAYPQFEKGSENKYTSVPNGIDCERCHGPGELHVNTRLNNPPLDTSKLVDHTIVNPGKLSVDLQMDLCQRCHLHGNTVLKEGKSFFDFKPGRKLNEFLNVFHAKYENESEIKFVSHAERLKMSKCFIVSNKGIENSKALRPYREGMSCVTCHNPHVSVQETSAEFFNAACKNCHGNKTPVLCAEKIEVRKKVNDNCSGCHMPKIESSDIVHGSVHDHYIAKRTKITKEDETKIRNFVAMISVNEKSVSEMQKARAFLNEYDKFSQKKFYLDSAEKFLLKNYPATLAANFHELVQLNFDKGDFDKIIEYANKLGTKFLLEDKLKNVSLTNDDAWAAYRIGEAFTNRGDDRNAERFFEKAVALAPFNPEFKNKLALSYFQNAKPGEARKLFMNALIEHPKYVPALTNLGYLDVMEKDFVAAEKNYGKALKLDPDYEPLLLNIAGLRAAQNKIGGLVETVFKILAKKNVSQKAQDVILGVASLMVYGRETATAEKILHRFLLKFPKNEKAKALLINLNSEKKNGKGKK